MEDTFTLEITGYTDPYCTWCWGSEPIVRKIEEVYGDQVKIRFKMGGLVADMRTFRDRSNGIGGKGWYSQVAAHWLEASGRHGMPVDERIYFDIKGESFSTFPASIAYKAAQFQDEVLADKYLRRLREGAAAERKVIQRLDVQRKLAEEVGLDPDLLVTDIESGRAREAFEADLEERRQRQVYEFPTFIVRNPGNGQEVALRGHQQFGRFVEAFQAVAGDAVQPHLPNKNKETIAAFVRKYGKVAPREIAVVFMVAENEIDKYLEPFLLAGDIRKVTVGNGIFYTVGQGT